mmetsp:Transcript_40640/g.79570  ORF Transcript_40640/g.79570 Transcript_40640/m.79570 type:complete len:372 (+) Transcript_40640:45-1160(+)
MSGHVAPKDVKVHGAYGDSVLPRGKGAEEEEEEQKEGVPSRPNVALYLKKIQEPLNTTRIRRKGCAGWPCQDGYLCDFCVLRPEWTAEAKADALEREVHELRQQVSSLKSQQADVETLRRAEKMVAGKHWSQGQQDQLGTIGALVKDSKARLEAIEATRSRIAAETVRDGMLQQLEALQAKLNEKERLLSEANQTVSALQQTLSVCQRDLRVSAEELKNKRIMIADAFKEKSRAVQDVTRANSRIEVQDQELLIKAQQTAALIERVQRLNDIELERDRYSELANLRAGLAQGVMDEVAADIVFAERVRDEHVTTVKRLSKENKDTKRMMMDQQTVVAKLRSQVQEYKNREANASVVAAAVERRNKLASKKR